MKPRRRPKGILSVGELARIETALKAAAAPVVRGPDGSLHYVLPIGRKSVSENTDEPSSTKN
jgi:hypothetical protein